jgi:tRNA-2-methylthio-N6-dimethylallyladenosine synthase
MMTYFFETYGCQMNSAESAALALVLAERGWTNAENADLADLIIINTCSVRITAETRVFGRLAHFQAEKRSRAFTLIVAGCMAERLGDELKQQFKAVDYVMGTQARSTFPLILDAVEQGSVLHQTDEKPAFSFSSSHLENGQFRSFVPIMHGCNNFCSYCIVPYVRGREVSRSPESVLQELRLLAEKGVREVTLLGQNVNSYKWEDNGKHFDFPDLLEMIAEEVQGLSIEWVRFLSSHPKDLSSKAIKVMAENPVFCRHLHLCVQHGSNSILEKMNRKYTRERYLELVAEIREAMPNISLSTDILIGFPGETDEDFSEVLSLMKEVKFLYSYMYHYNPREGTEAYKLPNRIPDEIKQKRLSQVIELQKDHTLELLKARIGSEEKILVEGISRKHADELIGRTARDEKVVFPGDISLIGSFVQTEIVSLKGNTFKGVQTCLGDS